MVDHPRKAWVCFLQTEHIAPSYDSAQKLKLIRWENQTYMFTSIFTNLIDMRFLVIITKVNPHCIGISPKKSNYKASSLLCLS